MPKIDPDRVLDLIKLTEDEKLDSKKAKSIVDRCIASLKDEIEFPPANKCVANVQAITLKISTHKPIEASEVRARKEVHGQHPTTT